MSPAVKLSYLIRGLPGHPLHPPLTDATIGAYTAATVMAFASVVGISNQPAAHGWWLALVVGLIVTSLTALTGLAMAHVAGTTGATTEYRGTIAAGDVPTVAGLYPATVLATDSAGDVREFAGTITVA